MVDIIQVFPSDFSGEEIQAVSARSLYDFLGLSKKNFAGWLVQCTSNNEYAIEGEDYIIVTEGVGVKDAILTIDYAKRIAMRSGGLRGEEVRQYFLNVEKSFKKIIAAPQVPQTYMEALEAHIATLKQLETTGEKLLQAENKIAVLSHSGKLYTTTEIAKELGFKSAQELNQVLVEKQIQYKINGTWALRSWYADKSYTSTKQHIVNERVVYDTKWTQAGREFILSKFSTPQ